MRSLDSPRLNYGGTDTGAQTATNHQPQPCVVGTADGEIDVSLPATPSYDRDYDSFLTLAEAVDQ
ncbi:hypothetical protein [Natrinema salifodinae]|uniref:Uncharacterized protein n=1 Tax=Natrinema salifodinae TaxID=1202768 RepID=A0A1I0QY51_9EURY|nr:hypothetical protein [Natrinema salifodinae]SEW32788.1 hypothetical protein SAMN05216285_4146 [Natrinema salifodinae]